MHPLPPHLVWSTDHLDLSDPFQRRWYLRQVLHHGKVQDVRALDFQELMKELDNLNLPENIYRLWKRALGARNADG